MKMRYSPTPIAVFLLLGTISVAQPPGGGRPGGPGGPGGGRPLGEGRGAMSIEGSVERLMVFDANKDDALSANEITDSRLQALWKRADLDGDGKVKRSELVDLLTKEATASESRGGPGGPGGPPPGRGQGGPGGGPGGFGGPPPGQGGPGGPRGPRPNPGEVLPSFFRESLQLTEEQITQLDQLQRDVDERLAKILTAAQREQLRQAPSRGPVRGEPPRRD